MGVRNWLAAAGEIAELRERAVADAAAYRALQKRALEWKTRADNAEMKIRAAERREQYYRQAAERMMQSLQHPAVLEDARRYIEWVRSL